MKLKEMTFHKRRENRPPEVEQMAEYVSERGWTLWEEWQDPWTDERTGEEHEGWWGYGLLYEEKIGEQLHAWQVFPVGINGWWPEQWDHYLRIGQMGWERYRESIAA